MLVPESVPEFLREPLSSVLQRLQSIADETLLQGFKEQPGLGEQLARALIGSDYLAQLLMRQPVLLQILVEQGETAQRPLDAVYEEFIQAARDADSDAELDVLLRRFRQRIMAGVIWRDLNRQLPMTETTAELSRLADTTIQVAADWHYRQLVASYGTPIGKDSGTPQSFVVLGMGKLGAHELNLSSDIDLIFTFPETGETRDGPKTIDNQAFFIRLGQRVIKSLDARTADDFVFRVDMRLRPHGQSGALVLNYDAMEDYYQTQGRDWERYAMIKARVVAVSGGHTPQQDAGRLMALLFPFTYRQYIDFSVIEALRSMKSLIARQVQRKGMNLDVKLGEGGIREIEFVVQAFQLIRGGREPRLRERQVGKMLAILADENYLPAEATTALQAAYTFLRNTEHAVQAWQDQQTQALPEDPLAQARLAWVMGFDAWPDFLHVLNQHRARVTVEFRAVIAAPADDNADEGDESEAFVGLWDGSDQEDEARELIEKFAPGESEALLQWLQQTRESRAVNNMQASSRTRLDAFVPRLLAMLARLAGTAELPSGVAETFHRVIPLMEAIARRSAYFVLLIENPTALHQLVKLCSASPWIAEQLSHHPALLDELLTPESLYAPPDKNALRDDLRRETLRLSWDDLEGHMETLRYFRSAHALRVAATEVTGALPLMKVSDYLTYIAEVILEHVLQLSWQQMVLRHGSPGQVGGGTETSPNLVIIGYGKLGGIELGHGSDLDLVFLHNASPTLSTDGEKPVDNLTFYTRLGQRIIHVLNTSTVSGKLYEVDMRLRPSGNSGMLVASLVGFEKYQLTEAWTWEHQALVRARVVAGDEKLADSFEQVRHQVLSKPRDLAALKHDVNDMREKMRGQLGSSEAGGAVHLFNIKQDAGGIVDIEFMVQFAVLAWAHQFPALTRYTDNIRILETLTDVGKLTNDEAQALIDFYKTYRSMGHQRALQQQSGVLSADQPLFSEERQHVRQLWLQLLGES
jgi:glutamate-ammonia-ligase adenylyltransferase